MSTYSWRTVCALLVVAPVAILAGPASATAGGGPGRGQNALVSVSTTDNVTGNGLSDTPKLSRGGRYVAFVSLASDLVPGDTNGVRDAFVRDTWTGTTTRISVSSTGVQADRLVYDNGISITPNGRYVTFVSSADNLVPGDTNSTWDVFVRDTWAHTTTRVSVASDGTEGNGNSGLEGAQISADGRYVTFESVASTLVPGDAIGTSDIFVHDRLTGVTTRESVATDGTPANSLSSDPAISGNGRYVAFDSFANNLVPGDTNGDYDVFLRDRRLHTTTRISVSSTGAQANGRSLSRLAMSPDGRYVAFLSSASNLVPGDTNTVEDAFVRDNLGHTTGRVNLSSTGAQADRATSFNVGISANGRYVVFFTDATNLVPDDTNDVSDVFVRDRWAGTTRRVSVGFNGVQANGANGPVAISADGSHVAFGTRATNLVPGIVDTNNTWDIVTHHVPT